MEKFSILIRLKLPITLRELFVSPNDYIELPIDAEGQRSRLILRMGGWVKNFAETLSSSAHKVSLHSVPFLAANRCYVCHISSMDCQVREKMRRKYDRVSGGNTAERTAFSARY